MTHRILLSLVFFYSINLVSPISYKSSLLRIDPTNILRTMAKYGGLILPDSVERDFQKVKPLCQCESAYLDVLNRELEIRNFTVSSNKNDIAPALRVGRLFLRWDSYMKPCIDLELESVDILVEFLNLILTRTNWNELDEAGFPPKTITTPSSSTSEPSTFLRVGAMTFSGDIRLQVQSRPLANQVMYPDISFDLASLNDLTHRIREISERNTEGRKGCTTQEVCDIISSYVNKKLKDLLGSTAKDWAKSKINDKESIIEREGKKIFKNAKDSVLKYAEGVKGKTEHDLEQKVKDKFNKWGIAENKLKKIGKIVGEVATEALNKVESVDIKIGKDAKKENIDQNIGMPYKEWLAKGYNLAVDRYLQQEEDEKQSKNEDAVEAEVDINGHLERDNQNAPIGYKELLTKGYNLMASRISQQIKEINGDSKDRDVNKATSRDHLQPDEIFFPSW